MIFSVQRSIEDYFDQRGLPDNDQFAVKLANLYATGQRSSRTVLLSRMARVRTIFFRTNRSVNKTQVLSDLLELLDRRFAQKKTPRTRRLRRSPAASQESAHGS
jgi:hypothetical protein